MHTSFAAELHGVVFSRPIAPDEAAEIREVANKVEQCAIFCSISDFAISTELLSFVRLA